ncbi:MAG: 6-phosphogluconolactonase [Bacilli bacterium]|nr:6-phosphogluconolactonase [Bacilli bacterium]
MLKKEFVVDQLKVKVYESEDEMGRAAAKAISEEIIKKLKEKAELNMVFAPAVSQLAVFKYLFKNEEIDWQRINAFHLDEYIGLSLEDERRIVNFAKKHIFSKGNFKAVYTLDSSNDPEAECERYSELLKAHPFDIGVIGIGTNGHIAYNEPNSADFNDPKLVKIIQIDQVSVKQAVDYDRVFAAKDDVTTKAITLTIPAIINADSLFVSVPRAHKQNAVYDTLNAEINTDCPATILRTHRKATMFLDNHSSSRLFSS